MNNKNRTAANLDRLKLKERVNRKQKIVVVPEEKGLLITYDKYMTETKPKFMYKGRGCKTVSNIFKKKCNSTHTLIEINYHKTKYNCKRIIKTFSKSQMIGKVYTYFGKKYRIIN